MKEGSCPLLFRFDPYSYDFPYCKGLITMNFFIDAEFDECPTNLISLAIVSEDGNREFYEVVDRGIIRDAWVKENVMTILEKDAIPFDEFQNRLSKFVQQFAGMNVIANHPNDIVSFCHALTQKKGEWIMIQPLSFVVDDNLSGKGSKLLHNALFDARATREDWFKKNGFT